MDRVAAIDATCSDLEIRADKFAGLILEDLGKGARAFLAAQMVALCVAHQYAHMHVALPSHVAAWSLGA